MKSRRSRGYVDRGEKNIAAPGLEGGWPRNGHGSFRAGTARRFQPGTPRRRIVLKNVLHSATGGNAQRNGGRGEQSGEMVHRARVASNASPARRPATERPGVRRSGSTSSPNNFLDDRRRPGVSPGGVPLDRPVGEASRSEEQRERSARGRSGAGPGAQARRARKPASRPDRSSGCQNRIGRALLPHAVDERPPLLRTRLKVI